MGPKDTSPPYTHSSTLLLPFSLLLNQVFHPLTIQKVVRVEYLLWRYEILIRVILICIQNLPTPPPFFFTIRSCLTKCSRIGRGHVGALWSVNLPNSPSASHLRRKILKNFTCPLSLSSRLGAPS